MLNQIHTAHLTSEGFTPEAIDRLQTWGVRSITNQEAKNLGIAYQGYSPSGLWFPFQGNFGQLRCDRFFLKYLSPGGSTATSWNPETDVVTEGFKDAAAGTLMGLIPTTAIAGVTHYRSLPQHGQTVVFDSDATTNPNGFTALVRAAIFLGGKAVAIPQDFGQQAGLVEFFKEFSPNDQPDAYQELLATAMTPLEMLYHLPSQWQGLSGQELGACVRGITTLARDFPEITGDRRSIEDFCTHLSAVTGYPRQQLLDRFPPERYHKLKTCRDHSQINTLVEVPIEICLARSNREALAGVMASRNCTAFNIAADLCGVSIVLDSWGQRYSDPRRLLWRFGEVSGMVDRELQSIWRSAQRRRCLPALPTEKIRRNVSYWQRCGA
jgi:hypothetical protein